MCEPKKKNCGLRRHWDAQLRLPVDCHLADLDADCAVDNVARLTQDYGTRFQLAATQGDAVAVYAWAHAAPHTSPKVSLAA